MEDEGPIQSLPDELLLKIFGRIDDAKTLVDGVALVSKRWHALARDAEAWASAELVVDFFMTDLVQRVMLRAPALRALTLDVGLPELLPTLLRSRVEITGTLFIRANIDWSEDGVASAVLALLWRSRRLLREVRLTLDTEKSCVCDDSGDGRSLLSVLAAMPELRRLELCFSRMGNRVPATCAPLPVWPPSQRLRELCLRLCTLRHFFPSCILALLRAAAPSLHSLSLMRSLRGPNAELEAALGLGVGLRDVVMQYQLPSASALAAWTSLESLQVSNLLCEVVEYVTQLDHFLRGCARIGSLRRLRGYANVLDTISAPAQSGLERCRQLLAAFRRARPEVCVDFTLEVVFSGHVEKL